MGWISFNQHNLYETGIILRCKNNIYCLEWELQTILTFIQIKDGAFIKFIAFNFVPGEFAFLKELHKQL